MHFNRTFGPLTLAGDLRAGCRHNIAGLLINLCRGSGFRATEKSALRIGEARAALPAAHPRPYRPNPRSAWQQASKVAGVVRAEITYCWTTGSIKGVGTRRRVSQRGYAGARQFGVVGG